jgi:hypothetical protein
MLRHRLLLHPRNHGASLMPSGPVWPLFVRVTFRSAVQGRVQALVAAGLEETSHAGLKLSKTNRNSMVLSTHPRTRIN